MNENPNGVLTSERIWVLLTTIQSNDRNSWSREEPQETRQLNATWHPGRGLEMGETQEICTKEGLQEIHRSQLTRTNVPD